MAAGQCNGRLNALLARAQHGKELNRRILQVLPIVADHRQLSSDGADRCSAGI